MDSIIIWGFSLHAWITIATVLTMFSVLLFTKLRADMVFLGAIAICFVGTFITEFISNTAAGVMFFPIMYEAAEKLGYEPYPFLIALMIAVNASFATPIGAPANMMVYGPGGYRFSDFLRIGVPLTLIVTLTGIAAACLAFPLTPLP